MKRSVEYSIKLYDKFTTIFGKFSSGIDKILNNGFSVVPDKIVCHVDLEEVELKKF